VHREIAEQLRGLLVDRHDARRLKRHLRILLDVEEVGRPEVRVALLVIGGDRSNHHLAVRARVSEGRCHLQHALELGEGAPDGRDPHAP
jgi:hypothetical protein